MQPSLEPKGKHKCESLILINNHTYTKHQSCLQIHWAELQKNVISLPYINSNEFVLMEIVNTLSPILYFLSAVESFTKCLSIYKEYLKILANSQKH